MSKSFNKQLILAKLESSYGVDPTPTATNSMLVRSVTPSMLEGDTVNREFIRSYWGSSGSVRTSNYSKLDFEIEFAGGGGTGATAPAWAPLLKACGFNETVHTNPITGTAQAGAASSMTLASGASAVDNFYQGLELNITGGLGLGQQNTIIAYNGTTKVATVATAWTVTPDNTSQYSIAKGVCYDPVSSIDSDSVTIYYILDGLQHVMTGARGTVSFSLTAKQLPVMKFSFMGMAGAVTDVAFPTPDFSAFQFPQTINTANTGHFNFLGFNDAVVESIEIDTGMSSVFKQFIGLEKIFLTDRRVTGKFSFEATTIAAKDWITAVRTGATGAFNVRHGLSGGNKVTITSPNMLLSNLTYNNSDGLVMFSSDAQFSPIAGNDEIRIVSH